MMITNRNVMGERMGPTTEFLVDDGGFFLHQIGCIGSAFQQEESLSVSCFLLLFCTDQNPVVVVSDQSTGMWVL